MAGGLLVLTDRQRVELALPARLMFNAAATAAEGTNDPLAMEIVTDLKIACNEPLAGLQEKDRRKVARRVERAAHELAQPFVGKCTAGKMAMVVFYFAESLIEDGILELYEGSHMAKAMTPFLGLLEEKFAIDDVDRSAKKQGVKLVERSKAMGFYQ